METEADVIEPDDGERELLDAYLEQSEKVLRLEVELRAEREKFENVTKWVEQDLGSKRCVIYKGTVFLCILSNGVEMLVVKKRDVEVVA